MRKRIAALLVALAIIIAILIAERHAVVRFTLVHGIGLATGYEVRLTDQRVGGSHTALVGLQLWQRGERVLDAPRVDVWYSLRDLLPGSTRRFGLVGVAIDRPTLTIVKRADGSYDFPLPKSGPSLPSVPSPPNRVPLRFFVRIADAGGSLRLEDEIGKHEPPLGLRNVDVNAVVDTAGRTHYTVRGVFLERTRQPFAVTGTVDVARGYAMHHMTARVFPMQSLANFLIDSQSVEILSGTATGLDARAYAIADANGVLGYHFSLGFDVGQGKLKLIGLRRPVENIRAHLGLYDDTFFLRGLTASLVGIPMRAEGGIFHFADAQIRVGVSGSGDMAQLRSAFNFSADQPLSGPISMGILVEGSLNDPTIVAHAISSRVYYRDMPFDALDARIEYHHGVLALAPLRLRYGGIAANGIGSLELGDHIHERLLLHFAAPADRMPYAGEILGSQSLVGDAAVDGNDLLLKVTGSLAAQSSVSLAAALFDFEPNGTANVAPFWMSDGGSGMLAGGYRLDRPNGTSGFWVSARKLALHASTKGTLPGVTLPVMPPIAGDVRGVDIVGGGSGAKLAMAGHVDSGPLTIATVPFDTLSASFNGSNAHAAIDRLAAAGPWGRFTGAGAFWNSTILARGRFDGTLDALRPLMSGIAAHGGVHGEVAIGLEPPGIIVQASGLQLSGASVAGIPVTNADGTMLVGDGMLDVYSAHVLAAGGDVVAAGSFRYAAPSNTNTATADALALVANDVQAESLHSLGLPLDGGRLAVTGRLAAGAPLPSFEGAVSVANGLIRGYDLDGSAGIALGGDRVAFDHVVAGLANVYGFADGSIGALTSGAPAYDLRTTVPAGDISAALRSMHFPTYMTEGTFNADLTIGGAGNAPSVSGFVAAPAGSVNGLPFLDAKANINAGSGGVRADKGSVLVGTTRAAFNAVALRDESAFDLDAPSATLSDFNNFFDTGDTLAGSGSIALSMRDVGTRLSTDGNVDVQGFRFRSLPIGDTRGFWSSRLNVVTGSIAVGGAEGLLRAHGNIALATGQSWQSIVMGSRYNLQGTVDDLDLGLWVAAVGFPQVPITGRAFGAAQVRGEYPNLNLQGSAQLRDGTLGKFPIDALDIGVRSQGSRIEVENAELHGPDITASASGSIGLRKSDPLDLQVRASTDDLPGFLRQITNAPIPVSGAFQGTAQVTGTFHAPIFDAAFNAQNVHVSGVPIETLFGSVRMHGTTIELHDAGATFTRGTATLAGNLPIRLKPLGLPGNTPLNFTLDVSDLDASIFNSVFGNDTQLGGVLGAHVTLAGTVHDPQMSGEVTLTKGAYTSDLERSPISAAQGTLSFNGPTIVVHRFNANVGSGTIQLTGEANLTHVETSGATFDGKLVAHGAQLNLPAYGSGVIDGTFELSRTTGDALLSGKASITNATIPFAVFLASGSNGAAGPSWPIAFNLTIQAGRDVYVRGSGYGAGMNIGGTGSVIVGGTLSAPTLQGKFTSTSGTLTYFDRAFRLQQGHVTFDPADGILPTLYAVGTTHVVNPDPDVARNPFGAADITITVSGAVNNLKIDFSSDPPGYSRDQIIALLAPFGGFVSGIQFNPYQVQIPGGAAAVVNNAPVPGGVFVQRNGTITVGQEAFSILNAQFASGLLAPLEGVLGQTLGVSDVNFTLDYFGNVGISVRRVLGRMVSAVFASTFGYTNRQSFGIQVAPDTLNSASLSFYYQNGQSRLLETPGSIFGPLLLGQPLQGQSGFSVTFQHFFK